MDSIFDFLESSGGFFKFYFGYAQAPVAEKVVQHMKSLDPSYDRQALVVRNKLVAYKKRFQEVREKFEGDADLGEKQLSDGQKKQMEYDLPGYFRFKELLSKAEKEWASESGEHPITPDKTTTDSAECTSHSILNVGAAGSGTPPRSTSTPNSQPQNTATPDSSQAHRSQSQDEQSGGESGTQAQSGGQGRPTGESSQLEGNGAHVTGTSTPNESHAACVNSGEDRLHLSMSMAQTRRQPTKRTLDQADSDRAHKRKAEERDFRQRKLEYEMERDYRNRLLAIQEREVRAKEKEAAAREKEAAAKAKEVEAKVAFLKGSSRRREIMDLCLQKTKEALSETPLSFFDAKRWLEVYSALNQNLPDMANTANLA